MVDATESAGAMSNIFENLWVMSSAVAPGVIKSVTMRTAPTACIAVTTVIARHTSSSAPMRHAGRPMACRWTGSKA